MKRERESSPFLSSVKGEEVGQKDGKFWIMVSDHMAMEVY
jgi:hypothetical protein